LVFSPVILDFFFVAVNALPCPDIAWEKPFMRKEKNHIDAK